jgi:hypothetical protein
MNRAETNAPGFSADIKQPIGRIALFAIMDRCENATLNPTSKKPPCLWADDRL